MEMQKELGLKCQEILVKGMTLPEENVVVLLSIFGYKDI